MQLPTPKAPGLCLWCPCVCCRRHHPLGSSAPWTLTEWMRQCDLGSIFTQDNGCHIKIELTMNITKSSCVEARQKQSRLQLRAFDHPAGQGGKAEESPCRNIFYYHGIPMAPSEKMGFSTSNHPLKLLKDFLWFHFHLMFCCNTHFLEKQKDYGEDTAPVSRPCSQGTAVAQVQRASLSSTTS